MAVVALGEGIFFGGVFLIPVLFNSKSRKRRYPDSWTEWDTNLVAALLLLGRKRQTVRENWLGKIKASSANSPSFITNFIFSLASFPHLILFYPYGIDQQKGKFTTLE